MRKITIIFSIFAFIVSSCGQTKKQTTNKNSLVCQQDTLIKLSETHGLLFMRYDNELRLWNELHIVDFRNNDTVKVDASAYVFHPFVSASPDEKYVFVKCDNKQTLLTAQYYPEIMSTKFPYICALVDIEDSKILRFVDCSGKWDKNSNWIENDEIRFWNPNNQRLFDIQKIDSIIFFELKKNANIQKEKMVKITDLELAKEVLKGRVVWGKWGKHNERHQIMEDEQGDLVYEILFRNGKTFSLYEREEAPFIAYFPQEDVLIAEGGHTSAIIFNLTTGEKDREVGNPESRIYSPSKQYRLNTYDNGQFTEYFIQEKSETQYKTIIEFSYGSRFQKIMGFIPEFIEEAFWLNDTILNFSIPTHFFPDGKVETSYYQLTLK